MARHASVEFRRELNGLFSLRSHWLRSSVEGARPGPPPSLNRKRLHRSIWRLQDLASKALAVKLAREQFQESVKGRRSWHPKKGKGHGRDAKKRTFKRWFRTKFGKGTYVYVFWNRRRCIYVGKTTKSGGRIAGHFDKHWFGGVSRIDVYQTNGRRSLPALECLAIHRFQPSRNKFRAERKKWTSKCELCRVHRQIKDELTDIFRLR